MNSNYSLMAFYKSLRIAHLTFVLFASFASHTLFAQTLEEVVVTARQQAESMMDVPATVTAFSSEDIEKLNQSEFEASTFDASFSLYV